MNSSNSEYDIKGKIEYSTEMNFSAGFEQHLESSALVVQPLVSVPMEGAVMNAVKTEASDEMKLYSQDVSQSFAQKNAMISRIRSNSACRNYQIGPGTMPKKRSQHYSNGKLKHLTQKQVDGKHVAELLALKEAQEEVLMYEVWAILVSVFRLLYATELKSNPALHSSSWFQTSFQCGL